LDRFRDLIQEGIEKKYYRKVDVWAVANILWATVNGIIEGLRPQR